MRPTRYLAIFAAAVVPVALLALSTGGCKEEESEPPPPAPTVAPAPPPVTTVMPEEDAGLDAGEDADADAGKPKGPAGPDPVKACCNALAQNMKSAPPDQAAAYATAVAICNGVAASGQGRAALGAVRAALKGASVPAGCQ